MTNKTIAAIFVFLVACITTFGIAFAADTAAPETVAQAAGETTKITWAYGSTIAQWASAAGSIMFAVIMFFLRKLPGQAVALLLTFRVDQILQKAIDYGVNAVEGASKGKVLEVDVGNVVLARAVQYVLDNAPKWLQDWMGGPEQIVQKIFARLNLSPNSTLPSVGLVLASAKKMSTTAQA